MSRSMSPMSKLPPIQGEALHTHKNIGLDICTSCHSQLVNAFEHCIKHTLGSGNSSQGMTSILDIDEHEDSKQLTTVPDFELVHNHSIQTQKNGNQMTVSSKTIVHNQDSQIAELEKKLFSKFSAQVYQVVLANKNAEINKLKQQLFEKSLNHKLEQTNTGKLSKALDKAVGYYTFAQEWKDEECKRLQQDIVLLKTYMSTLMACIIDAEMDKQKVVDELKVTQAKLSTKDSAIQLEKEKIIEIQQKLQQTYRDYVELHEEHEDLKRNSTTAKEIRLVQQKLDTVTAQYQTVSEDLMKITKDFDQKSLRCRQLEFELNEMVRQFNAQSAENKHLKSELEQINIKYNAAVKDLNESNSQCKKVIGERNVVELELRNLSNAHEQLKQSSQKENEKNQRALAFEKEKFTKLTSEFEAANKEIQDLKAEIAKLNKELAISEKDASKAINGLRQQLQDKETRISTLVSALDETETKVKMLSEQKEQLMIKSNELRVDLESEVNQVRSLTLDFKMYKQESEEKTGNLQKEIRQLTATRESLVAEGRQLVEEIRNLKSNLKKTKDQLQQEQQQSEENKKNWEIKEDELTSEIARLEEQSNMLTDQLQKARQELGKSSEQVIRLRANSSVLDSSLKETSGKLELTTAQLKQAQTELNNIKSNYTSTFGNLESTTKLLEETSVALKTLQRDTRMKKLETDEQLRAQKLQVKEMEISVKTISDRANETFQQLCAVRDELHQCQKDLDKQIQLYDEEKRTRERTECYLNLAYDTIMAEKRMRAEVERVMFQDKNTTEFNTRKVNRLNGEAMRKRLDLRNKLEEEYIRLSSFIKEL